MAAHPSLLIIGAPEAEDTISSLVQNVVLSLKVEAIVRTPGGEQATAK